MQIMFPSHMKRRYCSFLVPARDTQGVIYLRLVYRLSRVMSRKTAGHIMPTSRTLRRPQDYGFDNWAQLLTHRAMREDILTRPDLTRAAKAVFSFLMRMQRTTPWIIFSVKTLSREVHYHPRTVQRACRLLEDCGLLTVKARWSRRADPTSNRYIVHWQPYRPDPAVSPSSPPVPSSTSDSDAILPASVSLMPAPEAKSKTFDKDTWATNSSAATESARCLTPGGEATPRHDPPVSILPEIQMAQGIRENTVPPIQKDLFQKNDQPGPQNSHQSPLSPTQPSPPPTLDDVLFTLQKLHIRLAPNRLQHWIDQWTAPRILTISDWIRHAPAGAIRHPGGWLYRALTENWDAPSWELARQEREAQRQRILLRAEQETQLRTQHAAQWHAETEQFAETWEQIAPLIESSGGAAVRQRAEDLAREQLRAFFGSLFHPGSVTWQTYHVQAWKELYESELVPQKAEEAGET